MPWLRFGRSRIRQNSGVPDRELLFRWAATGPPLGGSGIGWEGVRGGEGRRKGGHSEKLNRAERTGAQRRWPEANRLERSDSPEGGRRRAGSNAGRGRSPETGCRRHVEGVEHARIIAGERSFAGRGAKRIQVGSGVCQRAGLAGRSVGVEDQDLVALEDFPWPPGVGLVEPVGVVFGVFDRDPLLEGAPRRPDRLHGSLDSSGRFDSTSFRPCQMASHYAEPLSRRGIAAPLAGCAGRRRR